jgi:hypothetical protein
LLARPITPPAPPPPPSPPARARGVHEPSPLQLLMGSGGWPNRWHSLASCDHGASINGRADSPATTHPSMGADDKLAPVNAHTLASGSSRPGHRRRWGEGGGVLHRRSFTSSTARWRASTRDGQLLGGGGWRNRRHSLASCDHGDTADGRVDSPAPSDACPPRASPPSARHPRGRSQGVRRQRAVREGAARGGRGALMQRY